MRNFRRICALSFSINGVNAGVITRLRPATAISSSSASFHGRKLLQPFTVSTPFGLFSGSPETSHNPYMGGTPLDSNLIIILAALVCALVLALGINSVIRCLLGLNSILRFQLRGRQGDVLEGATNDGEADNTDKGLTKGALQTLPIVVYGNDSGQIDSDCPICLAEFVEAETLRILPKCKHGFHVECIDRWLLSQSSCPTCRNSLSEVQETMINGSAAIMQIHEPIAVSEENRILVPSDQLSESGESLQGVSGQTAALPSLDSAKVSDSDGQVGSVDESSRPS
eukprot:Gb_14786 [translate_table: standard]